jgi:hypothetical protein
MAYLKLTGVELVKERRALPRDHPAYSLPQDRTAMARRGPDEEILIDYVVVYLEVGGNKIKLIEELADSMYSHFVHQAGLTRKYMEFHGVGVELPELPS